jgi:D-mannonate dehydratase
VEAARLQWTVVESVPVQEDIKTRRGRFAEYIEHYCESLVSLAAAGHPDGSTDMYAVMYEVLGLMQVPGLSLPMRPDHGQMPGDLRKKTGPGHSATGLLKGLAGCAVWK